MLAASYHRGTSRVDGTNAEICSVLLSDPDFAAQVLGAVSPEDVVETLDTRQPHEERATRANRIIHALARSSTLGMWLPQHRILPELEYANQFYAGYRDHTIHSLQVYLLGWYLFLHCDVLQAAVTAELRRRATDSGSVDANTLFREWWSVASLWHDWGYPFEAAKFITDSSVRTRTLEGLSAELGASPFAASLESLAGRPLSPAELRSLYGACGYFPWKLASLDDLMNFAGGDLTFRALEAMWRRRGITADQPIRKLIDLTTQAPVGREPYYDHGIIGALLLANWWAEIERFVVQLASSSATPAGVVAISKRESAAYQIMSLSGPLTCAAEAICFHNIALKDWGENELGRLWPSRSLYVAPSLTMDAHLFFLALCDTLQDWDRHHFVPQHDEKSRFRPTVQSAAMLLQAQPDHIALQLSSGQEVPTIRRLFHSWLADADIRALFRHGASFSRPSLVQSTAEVTVAEVSQSEVARDRSERALVHATAETALMLSRPDAVLKVGPVIEAALSEVQRLDSRLLPRQRDALRQSMAWRDITRYQAMIASSLAIGTEVLHGTISSRLGEGGFGVVYGVAGGSSPDSASATAYKVYHAVDLTNREKRELFKRGFLAMKRLSESPHVVDVYDYTELPVGFYMRLVNGRDMQQGLMELPVMHDRIETLLQIARALQFAHDHQILHRDVKPANVILDRDARLAPVLTDFDLAWMSDRSTIASSAYASMCYGSPEQFERRLAPHRSKPTVDVFSFGALVYFTITAQEPPPMARLESEHWDVMRDRLQGHLTASSIEGLVDLVYRCTRPDPGQRPQSMNDVIERLGKVRSDAFDQEAILDTTQFLREVALQYNGAAAPQVDNASLFTFTSLTGATRWQLEAYSVQNEFASIRCTAQLLRDPQYAGVRYAEIPGHVSRLVNNVLGKVRQGNAQHQWCRELRKQTGGSARTSIVDVIGVRRTNRNAVRLAHLLSDLTSVIE